VHQRLVDFLRLKSPSRDKLIAAIAEGDGDVAALRAQAYAEATVVPMVNRAVIAGVHNKLLQAYSGHVRKNHQKLADQFNTAAKEFAAAARSSTWTPTTASQASLSLLPPTLLAVPSTRLLIEVLRRPIESTR
jgi:hypothetical protein